MQCKLAALQAAIAALQPVIAALQRNPAALQPASAALQLGSAALQLGSAALQLGPAALQLDSAALHNGSAALQSGFIQWILTLRKQHCRCSLMQLCSSLRFALNGRTKSIPSLQSQFDECTFSDARNVCWPRVYQ
ncbi:hypothetical protein [Mariniblastus fucicola]|uniref:hypothetical protein n=1 Tax=Mariniblastus fucicola TaxID=980251 RepID=UPI0009466AB6|nr:hypothetical protein [Mariniblastus fucicola]